MITLIIKTNAVMYNQEFTLTNGYFVDKVEHLEIMGSELLEGNYNNGVKINVKSVPDSLKSLIGKAVKIIKGNWKGYIGNLKSANEKIAKVELLSRNKTLSLPITDICDLNKDISNESNAYSQSTSAFIGKTPAYYPQSPNMYGASPKWNPTTPGHFTSTTSPFYSMPSPGNWK